MLLSIEKDLGNELDTGAHSVPSSASLLVSLDNDSLTTLIPALSMEVLHSWRSEFLRPALCVATV